MKLYFLLLLKWSTPSQGSKLQQFGLWILLFLSRSVKFAFTFFSYSNSSCKPKSPDSFETYQIHFQLVHDFAFSHLRISCTCNNVVTIFCNISFLVNFPTSYFFCVRMSRCSSPKFIHLGKQLLILEFSLVLNQQPLYLKFYIHSIYYETQLVTSLN